MKNPLKKRLLRELRSELGKYLVIFILLIASIGFVSGFLVADGSMIAAYHESFEKYNIEDGHFRTKKALNRAQEKYISEYGVTLNKMYYVDEELKTGSTLRIFEVRDDMNQACLMEGEMPSRPGEIVIDRMYADNNHLHIGDVIESDRYRWTITGLVALSDYSALFSSNNDSMFDAVLFGTAMVTPEEFAEYSGSDLFYCYSWKYEEEPADELQEKEMSEDFLNYLREGVKLNDYVPRYLNQAIMFTGNDLGRDRSMMLVLLYIIIVILAFVFGVTISNTISAEAAVIGTLRASGYTKAELIRHYMSMPLIVTLIGAAVGNILGYTWLKKVCAAMYYGSYSLPTYTTIWNGDAFILTTIVPVVIMIIVTFFILSRKLRLTPLQFIRRDLTARKKKKALRLSPGIPFFSRFRLRVFLQNITTYLVLAAGVFFGNVLLMFGMGLPALLDHYQSEIENSMLCKYQYILQMPLEMTEEDHKLQSYLSGYLFMRGVETENPDAEKITVTTLKTTGSPLNEAFTEDIMVYGIDDDSRYLNLDVSGGQVYISSAYSQKYDILPGDTVTLREAYEDKEYQFTISGVFHYESALNLYMNREMLNDMLDYDRDFFCGYMSDSEITDINPDYVGQVIDLEELTKISRQLDVSMGDMMGMVDAFAILVFVVLIYLLSKICIEKNAQSISMAKILGYHNREISRIYLTPTTVIVLSCMALAIPPVFYVIKFLMKIVMESGMAGWMEVYISGKTMLKVFGLGAVSYFAVALLEMRKIRKVPMDEALKNVE